MTTIRRAEMEDSMQLDMNDVGMVVGFLVVSFAVWWALTEQRMVQISPLLAVAAALVSNYFFSGLAGAGLLEMGLRCLLAYVALRVTAEAAKRVTGTMPVSMRYAAQMPATIEFEEVQ